MKRYEVFKSEGGYRVCLTTWGDNPVIRDCPWYPTQNKAEDAAKKARFRNETNNIRMFQDGDGWIVIINDDFDFCEYDSEEEAKARIIEEIEKIGYDKEYIICNRRDLR